MTRQPSIKQKKAFDKVVENHGNVSKSMREVGYADKTAKNPKNLTESDGWKLLMEEHVSEQKLVQVHSEGLEATKVLQRNNVTTGKIESVEIPDHPTRHKFLETGYKIRGKIVKETPSAVQAVQVNINIKNSKANKIAQEYEDKLREELLTEEEQNND